MSKRQRYIDIIFEKDTSFGVDHYWVHFKKGEKYIIPNPRGKGQCHLYNIFRQYMLGKNRYRCQSCGQKSTKSRKGRLTIHHIVPICVDPNLYFDEDNCTVLCMNCHKKEHETIKLPDNFDPELCKDCKNT